MENKAPATLITYEEILKENGIEYSNLGNALKACVDKRNSDGHHHQTLLIYEAESGGITALLMGLRSNSGSLAPEDAIRKFEATKFRFECMADC